MISRIVPSPISVSLVNPPHREVRNNIRAAGCAEKLRSRPRPVCSSSDTLAWRGFSDRGGRGLLEAACPKLPKKRLAAGGDRTRDLCCVVLFLNVGSNKGGGALRGRYLAFASLSLAAERQPTGGRVDKPLRGHSPRRIVKNASGNCFVSAVRRLTCLRHPGLGRHPAQILAN
jgi:hypothetical protein